MANASAAERRAQRGEAERSAGGARPPARRDPQRDPRWRLALGPAIALLAAAALLVLDRQTGLIPLLELRERLVRAEVRVRDLAGERDGLAREARALRSDRFEIERAARVELGMVRPGELVIPLEAPR